MLQIELTQLNLDLLLEEPPAEPSPWRNPWIEADSEVKWRIRFWSDHASMHVEFTSDMDTEAKRDAITGAFAELQTLMPGQQQDSESSDADDELSAESAPGEPVHTSSQADS